MLSVSRLTINTIKTRADDNFMYILVHHDQVYSLRQCFCWCTFIHRLFALSFLRFSSGDVRPFIRSIFKTHELVDKARNGDRDVGSPLHYPALTTAGSSQETGKDKKAEAGAGSTASAVGGGGGSAGDKPSATTTAAVQQ